MTLKACAYRTKGTINLPYPRISVQWHEEKYKEVSKDTQVCWTSWYLIDRENGKEWPVSVSALILKTYGEGWVAGSLANKPPLRLAVLQN